MTVSAADLYAAYQTDNHGVAPYESLSPTEQGKWQAVAAFVSEQTQGSKRKPK
jgi:hypothetical protein